MFLPKTLDEYEQNKSKYADAWVLLEPNYAGRGGVRSTGYLMRQRMDERHEVRAEIEKNKQLAQSQAGQVSPHTWEGSFDYHGSLVPATLMLDESGLTPVGSMSIQNFSEGPIDNIERNGDTVTFSWTHDMGHVKHRADLRRERCQGCFPCCFGQRVRADLLPGNTVRSGRRGERRRHGTHADGDGARRESPWLHLEFQGRTRLDHVVKRLA